MNIAINIFKEWIGKPLNLFLHNNEDIDNNQKSYTEGEQQTYMVSMAQVHGNCIKDYKHFNLFFYFI